MSKYEISVDFIPDMDAGDLENLLTARSRGKINSGDLTGLLSTVVDERIIEAVSQEQKNSKMCGARSVAEALKDFRFRVSATGGWKLAQCTRGGVPLSELKAEAYESKIVPKLYFTGEVIDYDGPCGGFNLNNAWTSGRKAGWQAAAKLFTE